MKKAAARTQNSHRTMPRRLAAGIAAKHKAKPHCRAKTQSGEPCKANPLVGKKHCLMHTGDNASVLGTKGGRRRAVYNPDGLEPFAAPKTAAELFPLLAATLVEVRAGKMDPKVANSIAVVSAACMNALEIAALETRLQEVEGMLAQRPERVQ